MRTQNRKNFLDTSAAVNCPRRQGGLFFLNPKNRAPLEGGIDSQKAKNGDCLNLYGALAFLFIVLSLSERGHGIAWVRGCIKSMLSYLVQFGGCLKRLNNGVGLGDTGPLSLLLFPGGIKWIKK